MILFLFPLQNLGHVCVVSQCLMCTAYIWQNNIQSADRQTASRQTVLLCLTEQRTHSTAVTHHLWHYCIQWPKLGGFVYVYEATVPVGVGGERREDMTECLYNSELMGKFVNSWHQDQPRNFNLMSLMKTLQPISCQHWCCNERIMKQEDRDPK